MNNTEILISLSKTEDVINQNWDNLCTLGGLICGFFQGLVGL